MALSLGILFGKPDLIAPQESCIQQVCIVGVEDQLSHVSDSADLFFEQPHDLNGHKRMEAGVQFIDTNDSAPLERLYQGAKKSKVGSSSCRFLLQFERQ